MNDDAKADSGQDSKPKKSTALVVALIAGVVLLFCCCTGGCGGSIWYLIASIERDARRGPGFEPFKFDGGVKQK